MNTYFIYTIIVYSDLRRRYLRAKWLKSYYSFVVVIFQIIKCQSVLIVEEIEKLVL